MILYYYHRLMGLNSSYHPHYKWLYLDHLNCNLGYTDMSCWLCVHLCLLLLFHLQYLLYFHRLLKRDKTLITIMVAQYLKSKLKMLILIPLELKMISLCHQYRARPDCTSVQSVKALQNVYCWVTKFSNWYA